jgi:glycosyltransferase involved in cell wall biosynthesis
MRVTQIVAHPPFREGTGTVCYYNARALQDLGCQVRVYATGYGQSSVPAFYRSMRSRLTIGNAFLTPELLEIGQTDIIHLHYPFIFGSELAVFQARRLNIPLVVTYHNDLIGSGVRRPAFWLYNRLNAPFILKQARKIVVMSRDHATRSFFGGTIFRARAADVVEVGNGVDVETFNPEIQTGALRPRYGFQPEDFVLLFVSSLDRAHVIKGLGFLLETLSLVKMARIKLLVVGDGDQRPVYEKKALALGLATRVTFAGRLSHADGQMAAHYAAADAVVIPAEAESFGLGLAQGMAMAKPVIGSDIPGVRMLVRNGVDGFLVPFGDKAALAERILQLASSPELRKQFGAASRARILQNFTWKVAGQRLLALYQEVLAQ